MSYVPTIGLEVHAELNTKSKMFCGCKNEPHGSEPNTYICPICMAHPGTLPVPNEEAIKMVLMFGQAVKAKVASFSEFDRKNYFYPDIPKAYQISQYAYPFLSGGELEGIELTRVHLEEDTARSQHDKGEGSIVDFNRAGVPLMELVTEPVIHDAETAGKFARELQLVLRALDVSKANMEKGEMRVEANISVSKDSENFGTKVEVKNLNSFKSVESAIKYEISRQIELLENGGEVTQETRGWDENKNKTFSQRSKETAKDYRYFPDPDLPKIKTESYKSFDKTRLSEIMPVLPYKKREIYQNLGLSPNAVEVLIGALELDNYYSKVLKLADEGGLDISVLSANYLTSDIVAILTENPDLDLVTLLPEHFVELMSLLKDKKIGSRVAKDLLPKLFGSQLSPLEIAESEGLLQVTNPDALKKIVEEVITENGSVVQEYKSGKVVAIKFLVGQGMKKTKGSADPNAFEEMLIQALK